MKTRVVNTDKGLVVGIKENGVDKYLGIPFGKPPLKELRFLPPQEVDKWDGILEADTLPKSPMQPIKEGSFASKWMSVSEDCLYLNIYVPENAYGRKLPIMYYVYGGGYTVGSGSNPKYDGEKMAKNNDVIIITANYRVGVFGFMAHPMLKRENEIYTNAGVMDVIAGLKWVQNNIKEFGGDPDNVTVFGQSAGSSLINILLLSPEAKGLFHAVITQSGSPFNHDEWDIDEDQTYEKCMKYLKTVGIESEEDLYNAPAKKFLENPDDYARAEFCPYVDYAVIPDRLEKCYLKGNIHDVPVLLGCTADEASILVNGGDAHGSRSKTTKAHFARTIEIKYPKESHSKFIWDRYGPYAEVDPGYALYRFRSDNSAANMLYFASCLKEHNKSPVYYYIFERVPASKDPSFLGAYHGCEIPYIFQTLEAEKGDVYYSDFDENISKEVSKYWTNFAKNHNPNSDDLPYWSEFDIKNNMIMYLNGPNECREIKNKSITDIFEKFLAERTEEINDGLKVKGKEADSFK